MPLSPETIGFLLQNKIQNDRDWFAEHHAEFQRCVLSPLAELVEALTPVMRQIDPLLVCEPKVGKCISRIYRDTRFSRDKSIFRDNMWCVFVRIKKIYRGSPGFFFDFSSDGFSYGYGYYQADHKSLSRIRTLVLCDDPHWRRADRAFSRQKKFTLEGDLYKRTRFSEATERQRFWADRKNLCWVHHSEQMNMLFSETLADQLAADFLQLAPISQFLTYAEETKETE